MARVAGDAPDGQFGADHFDQLGDPGRAAEDIVWGGLAGGEFDRHPHGADHEADFGGLAGRRDEIVDGAPEGGGGGFRGEGERDIADRGGVRAAGLVGVDEVLGFGEELGVGALRHRLEVADEARHLVDQEVLGLLFGFFAAFAGRVGDEVQLGGQREGVGAGLAFAVAVLVFVGDVEFGEAELRLRGGRQGEGAE